MEGHLKPSMFHALILVLFVPIPSKIAYLHISSGEIFSRMANKFNLCFLLMTSRFWDALNTTILKFNMDRQLHFNRGVFFFGPSCFKRIHLSKFKDLSGIVENPTERVHKIQLNWLPFLNLGFIHCLHVTQWWPNNKLWIPTVLFKWRHHPQPPSIDNSDITMPVRTCALRETTPSWP